MLLDGRQVEADDLRALALVNYGHFTSMRVDSGRVRGLGLHMERLSRDCRTMFGTDVDTEKVRDYVRQLVRHTEGSIVVRVTIFDPALDLGHPGSTAEPHILVTSRGAAAQHLPPISLGTAPYERDLPQVKHIGLLGTIFHRRQAQLHGHDDVLFTDTLGRITEGATWNIGFVRGDQIVWPDGHCLPGVTMEIIKELHPSSTEVVTLDTAKEMTAAFISNAAIGLRLVHSIDGFIWHDADTTLIDRLAKRYIELQGDSL